MEGRGTREIKKLRWTDGIERNMRQLNLEEEYAEDSRY